MCWFSTNSSGNTRNENILQRNKENFKIIVDVLISICLNFLEIKKNRWIAISTTHHTTYILGFSDTGKIWYLKKCSIWYVWKEDLAIIKIIDFWSFTVNDFIQCELSKIINNISSSSDYVKKYLMKFVQVINTFVFLFQTFIYSLSGFKYMQSIVLMM